MLKGFPMIKVFHKERAGALLGFSFGVVRIGDDGHVPIEDENFARSLAGVPGFEIIEIADDSSGLSLEPATSDESLEEATPPTELEQQLAELAQAAATDTVPELNPAVAVSKSTKTASTKKRTPAKRTSSK
jgi:hypothetical protein